MNLANQITVSRLFFSAGLFVLLETACADDATAPAWWYAAFALFLVTILTDGLDGYVARSRGQVTAFGRIADPLADKIAITGVLALAHGLPGTAPLVPGWIVLVVIAREFLVSGLRGYLEGQGMRFGARWEGKTKLVVQSVYCGAVLFYPGHEWGWVGLVVDVALWTTLAITIYSGVSYSLSARRMLSAPRG